MDQSLAAKKVTSQVGMKDSVIKCKILDPFNASEAFPDEIAEDILDDLVSECLGKSRLIFGTITDPIQTNTRHDKP